MKYFWQDRKTELYPDEKWIELQSITRAKSLFVSNLGRIKQKGKFRKLYRLKHDKKDQSNRYVITSFNNERKLVHRLVAENFVTNPNPETLNQVNHIDGDKANNAWWNLEWTDNARNVIHSIRIGRNPCNIHSKLTDEKVKAIIRLLATTSLSKNDVAKHTGVTFSMIKKIKSGECWQHLDYYRNLFQ